MLSYFKPWWERACLPCCRHLSECCLPEKIWKEELIRFTMAMAFWKNCKGCDGFRGLPETEPGSVLSPTDWGHHRIQPVIGPTETKGDKGRQGETWEPMTRNDSRWLKINVVSWLVARFAIMPKMFQIIQGPSNVWKVHYCGKNFWHTCFFWTKSKWLSETNIDSFSGKSRACLPFPNESERLFINPYSRTVFPQIPKALGHERVQFTLVGLFSGFRIAASFFPELILEPREER